MHVQVRAAIKGSAFPDGDENDDSAISATYAAGGLLGILELLADQGFNLRSAGGRQIELGGEFAFAVHTRAGDADHDAAAQAAAEALNGAGVDAHVVEVQVRFLDDQPGALRDFVRDVSSQGLLIEEIAVGTPSDGRVPVQIYTVKVGA